MENPLERVNTDYIGTHQKPMPILSLIFKIEFKAICFDEVFLETERYQLNSGWTKN